MLSHNMLTKKDPQKFFTLIFSKNNEEYDEKEEGQKTTKVAAKKGKLLIDVVQPILQANCVSFETHMLFQESSKMPVSLNSDTSHHGGSALYVREYKGERNDVDRRLISRVKSDSKNVKRFSDFLEHYDGVNLDESSDEAKGDTPDDELVLESCWRDIITETEEMSNRQKVQQEAIWELFQTEVNFIEDMKVIIDVFQKCFRTVQSSGYMTEVNEDLIFANIQEVYMVNVTFWRRLRKPIDKARVSKQPICPSDLRESFEGFEDLFQPYIPFCNADTSNMKLPDYGTSTNGMIKQFVAWCDAHERCKRIMVSGFLIKPLQRVTKYSLLLKAILNKTEHPAEKCVAEEMMSRVETFVSKINSTVHLRQEQEKLNNVIVRLSDYLPIEPVSEEVEKTIKEYCNLNFKGGMPGLPEDEKRFLLKEGPMKLVEKQGKKDIHAFLFSDVFVVTKLKKNIDKYRITRPPYRLNKIVVRELKDPGQLLFIYLNEYGVVATAFVLQLVEQDEQERWRMALEKGKGKYQSMRREIALRDELWDDHLPTTISKNKVLRRQATIAKKTAVPESIPVETPPKEAKKKEPFHYQWDDTLIIVAIVFFIIINIAFARFTRLIYPSQ